MVIGRKRRQRSRRGRPLPRAPRSRPWVQYQTGAIVDLDQLTSFAREREILTFADGIQGIGQLPFDFEKSGLDFIVGGSHKWMTSPLGVGFLAARKESLFSGDLLK